MPITARWSFPGATDWPADGEVEEEDAGSGSAVCPDPTRRERELYHFAEAKEWADWQANGSVRVLSLEESKVVRETTDRRRIIRLRFVYRDKNSSIKDASDTASHQG